MSKLPCLIVITILLLIACRLLCGALVPELKSSGNEGFRHIESNTNIIDEVKSKPAMLHNEGYNLCMIPQRNITLDNLAVLVPCTGSSDQLWRAHENKFPLDRDGYHYFTIHPDDTRTFCLTPGTGVYTDKVRIAKCKESVAGSLQYTPMQALNYGNIPAGVNQNDYQNWIVQPKNFDLKSFQLINKAANMACLDAEPNEFGLSVIERPCNDQPTQNWTWKE